MANKTYKFLKLFYTIFIIVVIICFVTTVLYVGKHPVHLENIVLERWSIILTLVCIFCSLRFLRPKAKIGSKHKANKVRKYLILFFARAFVLMLIFYFNIICYLFLGSKNFIYLAFIVIFSLFLTPPNRIHLEKKEEDYDNQI